MLKQWWPAAAGLIVAVLVLVASGDRTTAAITVSVAVSCYLAAAATGRRWVAWAAVAGFSVLVVVSEVLGVAWWAVFAVAGVVLLAAGVAARVPPGPLLAHAAAVAGFGAVAVVALHVSAVAGGVLAGLALAAHAAWDVVLHRRDVVVPRSLSAACLGLDVPLGLGVVALAVTA